MPQRIVVFDTAPALLHLFSSVLSVRQYEVLTFATELHEVGELVAHQPDLLILGYIRGYLPADLAIIEAVRQHPATRTLPILVATTGEAMLREHLKSPAWPQVYVLAKPFDVQNLLDLVRQALGTDS